MVRDPSDTPSVQNVKGVHGQGGLDKKTLIPEKGL